MADEDPKIIIDEDWKARVQREKEEAARAAQEAPASAERAAAEPEAREPEGASFESIVSGLAMQTLMALGAMAPEGTKEVMLDLVEAKYLIDLLMVLRDKTKGNLTPKEQGMITETIAELQQGFVVRSQQMQEATLRKAGLQPEDVE